VLYPDQAIKSEYPPFEETGTNNGLIIRPELPAHAGSTNKVPRRKNVTHKLANYVRALSVAQTTPQSFVNLTISDEGIKREIAR
jgi:hypothetical protein